MGLKSRKSHPEVTEVSPKKRHSASEDASENVFVKKKKHSKHIPAIEAPEEHIQHRKRSRVNEQQEPDEKHELTSPKKKKKRKSEKGEAEQSFVEKHSHLSDTAADTEAASKHSKSPSKKRSKHAEDARNIDTSRTSSPSRKKSRAVESAEIVALPSENPKSSKNVEEASPQDKIDGKGAPVPLWPPEDMNVLFSRMTEELPKDDVLDFKRRQEKLDWNKVAFGEYSGEDCKNMWLQITTRLRKIRLLSEMIQDAQQWMQKPWTSFRRKDTGHPDLPKRPLTAYMLFYCANKDKVAPGAGGNIIAKKMGEAFNKLSVEEKKKWETLAEQRRKEYLEKMQVFQETHPGLDMNLAFKQKAPKVLKVRPPNKSRTPQQIFLDDRSPKLAEQGLTPQEIKDALKEKWVTLSDKKRLKYIIKAVDEHKGYREQLKEFMELHPDSDGPKRTAVLKQSELRLLLKSAGRPAKPLPSGYSYFMRDIRASNELDEVPKDQVLTYMATRWKALGPEEKQAYNEMSAKAKAEYEVAYREYQSKLPEEHREWERLARQTLKKSKPVTKKKARSEGPTFPKEPKKPPSSPYQLFIQSFVKDSGLSLDGAEKYWEMLPESDKRKFATKHSELMKKYVAKFQKFLTSLSKEELALYKEKHSHSLNGDASDKNSKTKSPKGKRGKKSGAVSSGTSDSEADSESDGDEAAVVSDGDNENDENGSDRESEEELSQESEDEVRQAPSGNVLINVHQASSSSDESESDSD